MNPTDITCIVPLKAASSLDRSDLTAYFAWLATCAEVIVVDGSDREVFDVHHAAWGGFTQHVAPDPQLATPMGKVGGVLTGVALASHERIIITDDDVRYDANALRRVSAALDSATVVRPQNVFDAWPWHAYWDTGRTLLNRMSGGDWPGTIGVRRSALRRTNGYDGRAMFENLELVRTVVASGGTEAVPLDVYVARHPSTTGHFWSQRTRQAYDELARPRRLVAQLAILPIVMVLAVRSQWLVLLACTLLIVAIAEAGRRRGGGRRVFPAIASAFAPAWLAERAVCAWMAVASRLVFGGIRYRGRILRHAATPMRELRARHRTPAADLVPVD